MYKRSEQESASAKERNNQTDRYGEKIKERINKKRMLAS